MVEASSKGKMIGQYKLKSKLGKGGFGTVYLAVDTQATEEENKLVAIKTFKVDKSSKSSVLKTFEAECQSASQGLEHPNVLTVLEGGCLPILEDGVQKGKPLYYTTSLVAENKEAFEFIEKCSGLNGGKMPVARLLFKQLLSAVDYIHNQGLAHRDLKLENCFLDRKCVLKMADFGLAKLFTGGSVLSTMIGTPQYMAPEIFKGGVYEGPPVDIFACGVVLFMLVFGEFPFFKATDEYFGQFHNSTEEFMGSRGINAEPVFLDLAKGMTRADPEARMTLKDVMAHEWMQGAVSSQEDCAGLYYTEFAGSKAINAAHYEEQQKARAAFVDKCTNRAGEGEDAQFFPDKDSILDWQELDLPVFDETLVNKNGFYSHSPVEYLFQGVIVLVNKKQAESAALQEEAEEGKRILEYTDPEMDSADWKVTFKVGFVGEMKDEEKEEDEEEKEPDSDESDEELALMNGAEITVSAYKVEEGEEEEGAKTLHYISFDLKRGDRILYQKFVREALASDYITQFVDQKQSA